MQLFPSGLGNRSLANTMPPGYRHRKGLELGSKTVVEFHGQTGRKIFRKMSAGPFARHPPPPHTIGLQTIRHEEKKTCKKRYVSQAVSVASRDISVGGPRGIKNGLWGD